MFDKIRRILRRFLRRSSRIDREPLNRVSLIVIIAIDLFIVFNVFTGLDEISRWHVSPSEAYPCYLEWKDYRNRADKNEGAKIEFLLNNVNNLPSFEPNYPQLQENRLGRVSDICLKYAEAKDAVYNDRNKQIIEIIARKQADIGALEEKNRTIRTQYDSTILEKIAGQPRERSINLFGAEKAKQELDKNTLDISTLKQQIKNLKKELLSAPESLRFLAFLKDGERFKAVERGYERASFWYPSIQLSLQSIFLLPLIIAALLVRRFAEARGYGLVSLISWHLLVIFSLPFILKIFEFFQIGVIFKYLFNFISVFLGRLLFLISYIYILIIPLVGFGIIKFCQKIVLNTKNQAANRVQELRCIKCAKRIRHNDIHCPHCSYNQYIECPNCRNPTYKYLPYCKECGYSQES